MDDKMIIENSENNISDKFIDFYIYMVQLQQQADILDQISILMINTEQYKQNFQQLPAFKLLELHQSRCKSYEEQILVTTQKVIYNPLEDGNLMKQEELKQDQLDQSQIKMQVYNHYFGQQSSPLQLESIEQKQQSEKTEDIKATILFTKINYQCVQQLRHEFQWMCIQYDEENCDYLIIKLLRIQQLELDFIKKFMMKILDEYILDFQEKIIWEFPNTNYQEMQILNYIGYLIYKKIKDFKNFFNITGRNCDIQELNLMVSIFLLNRHHINQTQKTNLFENMIEMYTQQLYTYEENTIKWGFSNFEDKSQNFNYQRILQLFQIFKQNPLNQNIIFQKEIIELQICQQQLLLFQVLQIKSSQIQDLINQIQILSITTFDMNELPSAFIRKLLIDIFKSPVFKKSVGLFKKYFQIQNGLIPIFNDITVIYINCETGSTSGQTSFDGMIIINIFKAVRAFYQLNNQDFKRALIGWVIKISIHEYFHYILRYCLGQYYMYTPDIKKHKKLKSKQRNTDLDDENYKNYMQINQENETK